VVHRLSVHIPGAATPVPRFLSYDRLTCSAQFPAIDVDDFLADSGSLCERE
jgi:hypothetical protein